MKLVTIFIYFTLFFSSTLFAQKVINHKVKSGESIYSIAKKYDVTQDEIYNLNPKLKGSVLGLKSIVKISNKKFKVEEKEKKTELSKVEKPVEIASNSEPFLSHKVIAKETLYSISKKYGVSMESICDINPELKTGNLKVGKTINLPSSIQNADIEIIENQYDKQIYDILNEEEISKSNVTHIVLPKQTLFGISKQYKVSIDEIKRLNPSISSELPVGFQLIIKKGNSVNVEKVEEKATENAIISETPQIIETKPLSFENLSKAEFLIAKASENIGTRYRSGGTTNAGFDCSGLIYTTFKNIEITLPRTSNEQSNYGLSVDKNQAQKGDLIFFSTNRRGNVNHVGMVTEILGDEIKFIHSSIHSGVIISSTKDDYYARNFVKIKRVLEE